MTQDLLAAYAAQINDATRETLELLVNAGIPTIIAIVALGLVVAVIAALVILFRHTAAVSRMADSLERKIDAEAKQTIAIEQLARESRDKTIALNAVLEQTRSARSDVQELGQNLQRYISEAATKTTNDTSQRVIASITPLVEKLDKIDKWMERRVETEARVLNTVKSEIIEAIERLIADQEAREPIVLPLEQPEDESEGKVA